MTEHLRLIAKQLENLEKMNLYLAYSLGRSRMFMPIENWDTLSNEQHEVLAALRVRFSEFQEHLSKTMRAIAIEEDVDTTRFGSVLAYMEKLDIIVSSVRWKLIREIRNAVNHIDNNDSNQLKEFFSEMLKASQDLFDAHQNIIGFCNKAYGLIVSQSAEQKKTSQI